MSGPAARLRGTDGLSGRDGGGAPPWNADDHSAHEYPGAARRTRPLGAFAAGVRALVPVRVHLFEGLVATTSGTIPSGCVIAVPPTVALSLRVHGGTPPDLGMYERDSGGSPAACRRAGHSCSIDSPGDPAPASPRPAEFPLRPRLPRGAGALYPGLVHAAWRAGRCPSTSGCARASRCSILHAARAGHRDHAAAAAPVRRGRGGPVQRHRGAAAGDRRRRGHQAGRRPGRRAPLPHARGRRAAAPAGARRRPVHQRGGEVPGRRARR